MCHRLVTVDTFRESLLQLKHRVVWQINHHSMYYRTKTLMYLNPNTYNNQKVIDLKGPAQ